MPSCKVLFLTNFPEGNWERSGDEGKAAHSLIALLQQNQALRIGSPPDVSEYADFRQLILNISVKADQDYTLFLSSLHNVNRNCIAEALGRAISDQLPVLAFASNLRHPAKSTDNIHDLLYYTYPKLTNCKLARNASLRFPGLMIRNDVLMPFADYLSAGSKSDKMLDRLVSSDGVAILLRLYLLESKTDIHLVDNPVFQMRNRCEDIYAMPTLENRLSLRALHSVISDKVLRRKTPVRHPRYPLSKKIRKDYIIGALKRMAESSSSTAVKSSLLQEWYNKDKLVISHREALRRLQSLYQRTSLRVGCLATQVNV